MLTAAEARALNEIADHDLNVLRDAYCAYEIAKEEGRSAEMVRHYERLYYYALAEFTAKWGI